MRPRRARGAFLLGMAATIALLGFLAHAVYATSFASYLATARLRWRLTAQRMAEGGIATAQIRLAEDPDWKGEIWDAGRMGRVVILRLDGAAGDESDETAARASEIPRAEATTWIEARAEVPAGHRPFEVAVLRASLLAPEGASEAAAHTTGPESGTEAKAGVFSIRSMHWISPSEGSQTKARPDE